MSLAVVWTMAVGSRGGWWEVAVPLVYVLVLYFLAIAASSLL